jgi:ureidoglycolate lyase
MGKIVDIPVKEMSNDQVDPYGKIIAIEDKGRPEIQGEGWQCWFPLGKLQNDYQLEIGMVVAAPDHLVINKMEKHPNRTEWVFAIDKPYIQVVALSDTATQYPDNGTVRAFMINPGEGILINKDVWHAPGIAPFNDSVLYGFVLGRTKETDEAVELGLVEFKDEKFFRCKMD